jgi:CDP-6-deoxy-D-xylo-4-hexulose-3-dehydrase
MMYPIILREGDKWDLIRHLEESGIDTREMLPLTNQPCYDGMFDEGDYPVAKWINEQGFYVGCSQYLTDEHMGYVVEKMGEYFG